MEQQKKSEKLEMIEKVSQLIEKSRRLETQIEAVLKDGQQEVNQ